MSQANTNPELKPERKDQGKDSSTLLVLATLTFAAGFYFLMKSPLGVVLAKPLNQLFALDSQQIMWYITRAAGLTSYLLIWFSSVWGLAISSKFIDTILHRSFTYDFHQYISLLAVGFILLHIVVLLFDRYLPYTITQILFPFLSPYRPLWVGIGVIAFYLTLLVTVTFYMRKHIGMRAFRLIHIASLAAYLGATIHGFFAGTDSSLGYVQLMYAGTFLVMVFLSTYWIVWARQNRSVLKGQTPVEPRPPYQRRPNISHT